jgi:hypothetical protein
MVFHVYEDMHAIRLSKITSICEELGVRRIIEEWGFFFFAIGIFQLEI